jgi:hypothetical protein
MSTTNTEGLGSEIYQGSSELGIFTAKLGLGVGVVVGVFMMLMGIYIMMYNEDDKYLNIQAKIAKADCTRYDSYSDSKSQTKYKCKLIVAYMIDGKMYQTVIHTDSSTVYMADEPITIMVEKANFNKASLSGTSSSMIGSVLFGFALVMMGLCYLNYWMSTNFKVYSAGQGVGTAWRGFGMALR